MRCISKLESSDSDAKHVELLRKDNGTVAARSKASWCSRGRWGGRAIAAVSVGSDAFVVAFMNQRASKAVMPFQQAFTGTGSLARTAA